MFLCPDFHRLKNIDLLSLWAFSCSDWILRLLNVPPTLDSRGFMATLGHPGDLCSSVCGNRGTKTPKPFTRNLEHAKGGGESPTHYRATTDKSPTHTGGSIHRPAHPPTYPAAVRTASQRAACPACGHRNVLATSSVRYAHGPLPERLSIAYLPPDLPHAHGG